MPCSVAFSRDNEENNAVTYSQSVDLRDQTGSSFGYWSLPSDHPAPLKESILQQNLISK